TQHLTQFGIDLATVRRPRERRGKHITGKAVQGPQGIRGLVVEQIGSQPAPSFQKHHPRRCPHTMHNPLLSASPACQTQQTTLTTIGQGQNPLKTSTPEAAYSGRNSHSMSCWGVHSTGPKKGSHHGPHRPHRGPDGPTACPPPQEGNRPSCPTPDLRPLAATSSAPGSERAEWEPCGVPGTPPYAATWPSKKSSCPPG